jgi:hypothetical protein
LGDLSDTCVDDMASRENASSSSATSVATPVEHSPQVVSNAMNAAPRCTRTASPQKRELRSSKQSFYSIPTERAKRCGQRLKRPTRQATAAVPADLERSSRFQEFLSTPYNGASEAMRHANNASRVARGCLNADR